MDSNNPEIQQPYIVIKASKLNERQGFLTPILKITEDGYEPIIHDEYPSDILVSKDYPSIDEAYGYNELFILESHEFDIEKSHEKGKKCYWAETKNISHQIPNTLIPILDIELPPKETGNLPLGVIPPKGVYFINNDTFLYGPLISPPNQNEDGFYIIEPYTHPNFSFGRGNIGKFKVSEILNCIVTLYINYKEEKRISSLKHLSYFKKNDSFIDYLPDEQLVKVLNQQNFGKQSTKLGKKEAERLQQAIIQFEKNNRSTKDDRLERLKTIIGRYLSESDIGYELIKEYLNSNTGQKFLGNYIEVKMPSLLNKYIDQIKTEANLEENKINAEIEKKNRELTAIKEKIDLEAIKAAEEINNTIQNKEKTIEKILAETEEETRQLLAEKEKELSEKISLKENELENLKQNFINIDLDIKNKLKTLNLTNKIEELKGQCDYYEIHNKKLAAVADGYKATLKGDDDNTDLQKKIGEMQAITKVLSGSITTEIPQRTIKPLIFCKVIPESAQEVVESLSNQFMQDNGRIFNTEEMTNLVVSVNQSFLTILSGPPGTGKTTTATRLAKALHLGDSSDEQNFLHIPVGRGWVSSRDLLGFYNSLKNVYQESRTGLYNFLSRPTSINDEALKLILLDEANLSSIEHYWSDFLGLCDVEHFNRPIETGIPHPEKRIITVNENTRFIATINNDATTERLSPRLIDRAPIINLSNHINSFSDSTDKIFDGAITAKNLRALFYKEGAQLNKSDEITLNNT
ncbi:AAA family ATPase [Photobacterium carnosum]|uniref:AAA family ATPase n=1 Tax=Photobacterium carnosum TaxID=2023717 RepID=UPI00242B222F|nr:AAA family ATPase [Photobacterium carnosum]